MWVKPTDRRAEHRLAKVASRLRDQFGAFARTGTNKKNCQCEHSIREGFNDLVELLNGLDKKVLAAETETVSGAKTVRLTWEELGMGLGVDVNIDENSLIEQAFQETSVWVKEYEKDNDVELTENLKNEIEFAIQDAIQNHWSIQNIISRTLDLDGLVKSVNEWGRRGPQMAEANEEYQQLPSGDALTDQQDDEGVSFGLLKPFEVVYAEAAYCVMSIGYEGHILSDFDALTVPRVMRWIAECEGRKIDIDLDRWDERRSSPRYQDLVKIIADHPEGVKPRNETTEVK